MPLSIIPSETFAYILSFLHNDYNGEGLIFRHINRVPLLRCSLVNSQWRAAALPLLWSNLDISFAINGRWPSGLRLYHRLASSLVEERANPSYVKAERISFVKSIYIQENCSGRKDIPKATMSAILRILRLLSPNQLQSLLLFTTPIGFTNIAIIRALFPAVVQNLLRFVSYGSTPTALIFPHLPDSLQRISIESTDDLTCIFLLPRLRSVTLRRCSISFTHFAGALQRWGSHLEDLTLYACFGLTESTVIDGLFDTLASYCPNLVGLDISVLRDLDISVLGDLATAACSAETRTAVLCRLITSCRRLRNLWLRSVTVSDAFIKFCAAEAYSLRRLYLDSPTPVNGEGIVDVKAWVHLIQLTILYEGGGEMNVNFVRTVLDRCRSLEDYRLGNMDLLL